MKLNYFIAVLSIIAFARIAGASGDHAGGHGSADAIGRAGNPEKVTRSISIDMADSMRFTPSTIAARQGETIRFIVKNSGKIPHEMVLGTEKELMEHYEAMKKYPEMEHADDNMVTVQPGKTGEIIWQFTKAGTVSFACLLPGHYEAGMKGAVKVKAGNALSEGKPGEPGTQQYPASMEMTDGVIRKVDKTNSKITIKHGEIKNLDMPGMTMVFQVKQPEWLDKVEIGDKVKFRAEKAGSAFVITDIQPE